jgi:putative photosynthetic complex assembly protein 2
MTRHLLPFLYALFLWWASTGAIIALYRLPRSTYRLSFAALTGLLGISLTGLWLLREEASVAGAYGAFTCATLVWGWQLAGYFMGFITGPQHTPGTAGPGEARRFFAAVRATLYHELAALAGLVVIAGLTWEAPNQVGVWTYLLLLLMHQAAKLNIFFGARNFSAELLPEHMRFLGEFFRTRPINPFFPVSVTVSVVCAALMLRAAFDPATPEALAVALTFLGFLALLGLLEIWLLVTPPAGEPWGGLPEMHQR